MSYKDALGEYAILKRITGLTTVQYKSRPAKYESTPEAFARKDKDYDGNFLEDFSQNVIPGAITGLAPFFNDLKDTFWVEDIRILHDIVENGPIRIRFPNTHPDKPGRIIKPTDIDPRNYSDYFFQSPELQMRRMEGGKYVFELQKDPIDALLYYCYKNDHRVLVRDGNEISKYVVGRAQYELILPKQEVIEDKSTLIDEIKSMTLLGNLSYEKQKYIARIMKLRLDTYENPDPDTLFVELGHKIKQKTKESLSGMTPQQRFVILAEMSNEDLMLQYDLTRAIDLRVITRERGEYLLNSEKLENVENETDLFRFFKDSKNADKYKDLMFLIGEKEKLKV